VAVGLALLWGRKLEARDAARADVATDRIAVINQAFADRYWPGENAIGKRVRQNGDPPEWVATVVGVVANVRQWGLEYPVLREMYFAHSTNLWAYTRLVVRASGDPQALVPALRQAVREIDSQIPFSGVRTMDDLVTSANERRRFYTLLVTFFAVTALILVIAGTYGVMSYYVSQRTHEVGVRVALGADSRKIMNLFLRQGARLVLLGLVFGLVGSVVSAKLTSSMVFGISPFNPLFMAGGALVMTSVAFAAIAVPVLRAVRVDPNQALRAE
jgi:hypothetical protein